MNFGQYFCNLDQAYLMATNTSSLRTVRMLNFLGSLSRPYDELTFTLDVPLNTMKVSIKTNYIKKRHYERENEYYHKSNTEVMILKRFNGPLYSGVRESLNRETLITTLQVLL